ncbi:hypothetical protein ACLLO4_00370 [Kutzneria viridogrisea]|uniref:hypothetical protein n=1 Tax=Kutzneria viridogrisea TaxID=47990 RepID=UPI00398CE116
MLDAAASVLATAARPSQTDLLLPIRATHSCPASVTLHALTELATLRVGLIRDLLRRVRGAGHDAELWDEVLAGIDAGLHDLAGPRPAGR